MKLEQEAMKAKLEEEIVKMKEEQRVAAEQMRKEADEKEAIQKKKIEEM